LIPLVGPAAAAEIVGCRNQPEQRRSVHRRQIHGPEVWPVWSELGTFLRNHAPHIAAMDLFVVPTISFIQLYVLVIVRLARRELVWINVTRHPTAEWIAQQITEAFLWNEAPRYLIRDQDAIYGAAVTRRLRARHQRQTNCSRLAVAEWARGEADRHDPPRMPRPHDRIWGGASASDPW
jgi:hypothetical protein